MNPDMDPQCGRGIATALRPVLGYGASAEEVREPRLVTVLPTATRTPTRVQKPIALSRFVPCGAPPPIRASRKRAQRYRRARAPRVGGVGRWNRVLPFTHFLPEFAFGIVVACYR